MNAPRTIHRPHTTAAVFEGVAPTVEAPENLRRRPLELPAMVPIKGEAQCWCASGREDACPAHGVDASLARQDRYWQGVGGHD